MMNAQRTQEASSQEVPFVCNGCTRIFRARLTDLVPEAGIRCGSCGNERSGASLLSLLPAYMRRLAVKAR